MKKLFKIKSKNKHPKFSCPDLQTWLIPLEVEFSVSRFEPVIGDSTTQFKFFKFGL